MGTTTGDEREWFLDKDRPGFLECLQLSGTILPLAILRGLGVLDVDFLEDLYSKSWMKITVGTGCSASIQLDTGTVQGSVLFPLLFDLFLNALLQLLDATGITHGIKRTPQWNHSAFADDLSIYVGTVRDGNKLLEVIHEFEH